MLRRKIRCSGEKPTCSSCIRYQEICHYSPLATPRRRAGKRAKTQHNAERLPPVAPPQSRASDDFGDRSNPIRAPSAQSGQETTAIDALAQSTNANASANASANPRTDTQNYDDHWRSEAKALRSNIEELSQKFDAINSKLDKLIGVVGKRQRSSRSASISDDEAVSDDSDNQYGDNGSEEISRAKSASESLDFSSAVDKTSRFGIDPTNVGIISDMVNSINEARDQQRQSAHDAR
ncbi:hypothetical protein GGI12_005185, partial [Dipsacomyces acuminosporus]